MKTSAYRKSILLLFTIIVSLFSTLFAVPSTLMASEFEGVIYVSMLGSSEEGSRDLKYFVKKNQLRIETYTDRYSKLSQIMIFDYEKEKLYTLLVDGKQFFESSLASKDFSSSENIDKNNETLNLFKPKKTEKTKVFHGYTCEQWIINEGDEVEIEMWIAKGFSPIKGIGGKIPVEGGNVMPFLVITRLSSGEELSRMEVSKIVEKELDESIFKLPGGYNKITLPE